MDISVIPSPLALPLRGGIYLTGQPGKLPSTGALLGLVLQDALSASTMPGTAPWLMRGQGRIASLPRLNGHLTSWHIS